MYANNYGVLQSRKNYNCRLEKKDKKKKNYPFPEFEKKKKKIKLDDDITVNDVLKICHYLSWNKIAGDNLYKKTNNYLKNKQYTRRKFLHTYSTCSKTS